MVEWAKGKQEWLEKQVSPSEHTSEPADKHLCKDTR